MKQLVFAGVAMACLAAAGSAFAAPDDNAVVMQGEVGGGYSHITLDQSPGSGEGAYGVTGAAIAPFGGGFSAQVDGDYQRISGVNLYDVAGAASLNRAQGRVGVNVGYSRLDAGGTTISSTNYGVFGEYYLNQQVTFGVRGGGDSVSVTGASRTGGYVGGQGIAYVAPDIALSGNIGYVDISGLKQTNFGARGEWLVSEQVPVSGYVALDRALLNAGGGTSLNSTTISVGVKLRFGGSGSLSNRQRTGVDNWGDSTIRFIF